MSICYLHRLALQQGEVKGCPTEEGLSFETFKGPQAAGGGLAQKLNRETWRLEYAIKSD